MCYILKKSKTGDIGGGEVKKKNKVDSTQYGVCTDYSRLRKNLTAKILLPTAYRLLFTAYCLLLTAYCLLIGICLLPTVAYAHKVSIYAYAEDGMVFSEGYFADGTRSRSSRVEVLDAKTGEKLLEGKTGNDGKFSFKIPKAASLKLILHASMGHQNDYTLSKEEVREAMGIQESGIQKSGIQESGIQESGVRSQESGVKDRKTDSKTQSAISPTVVSGISSSEIEAIVEKAVDRKLQPVIRMLLTLKENSEKPGITEILGGIGYITGLMGIVMYFKSRRQD